MKLIATLGCAGLLAAASTSNATIVGFGQLGGNNTQVPVSLASNAVADAAGYTVSNGTTPGIALAWDINWDVHTSAFFNPAEAQTAVNAAWDNGDATGAATGARVGQLDTGTHTIGIIAAPGAAVVLNSFDFAHTAETAGTTAWTLSLTDAASTVVWTQNVAFTNGQTVTVTPNFTGALGASYTLTFSRTASSYVSDGRHAIDNFSFNQTAVPEPTTLSLLGLGTVALLRRRNAR